MILGSKSHGTHDLILLPDGSGSLHNYNPFLCSLEEALNVYHFIYILIESYFERRWEKTSDGIMYIVIYGFVWNSPAPEFIIGNISSIMSVNKSDGKLNLLHDTRSHQKERTTGYREPEHAEERINVSEDSSE